ncbi:MAG: S8 family serine peptidase [Gemmatimonadota bacterium]|nr:S8 family serine peptidase [Gemmatimonadota bacterium]
MFARHGRTTGRTGALALRRFVPALTVPLLAAALAAGCGRDPVGPPPAQQTPADEPDASAAPGQQQRPQFVEDQYIIKFRPGEDLPPGIVNALADQHGLGIRHEYRNVFEGFSAVVPPGRVQALRNHPMVESVEPVGLFYLDAPAPRSTVSVPQDGLRLRLVADDLPLADGQRVDQWANAGGSEGPAAQSRQNRRPVFHAAGVTGRFAGHAHVGFNESDTDEYLEVSGVSGHGSATLVAVFSQDNLAPHNHGIFAPYQNTGNRGTFATMYVQPSGTLGHWDFSIQKHTSTFAPSAGSEHVAVWRIDGSNVIDFQVDGVSHGSFPITSDMHSTFAKYLIGVTRPANVNPYEGQIAELVFYDRPLSDCERDDLVAALGTQYGIDTNGVGGDICSAPAAPTNLAASTVDHRTIDLTWTDASTDEDGFTVERRQGQTGTFGVIAQTAAGATNHTDVGLAGATEYCYRVLAFGPNGDSDYSAIECATTDPAPPPPPPVSVPSQGLRLRLVASELSLAQGAGVDAWPNLGGSEGAAAQGQTGRQPTFHAPGATGKFAGHAHVGFNEGTSGEFLDVTGVSPHGSSTLVAVFSQDDRAAHNYGLLSIYADASNRGTFATMYSLPGLPLGYWDFTIEQHLSTFSPTAGAEHIAVWRIAGSDAIDFQVDGVQHGSFPITSDMHPVFSRYLIGATDPTGTNPFAGQLAELVMYDRALPDCERDAIVADLGAQYAIDVNGVTGGSCSPPAPPSSLSAVATSENTIDLSWTDGSIDEDGFRIERRQGPSGEFEFLYDAGPGVTTFGDAGLAPDTELCYRVAAFNGDGISAYTNEACATTAKAPPPAPPITVPSQGLRLRLVASELTLANGAGVDVWPNFGGSEDDAAQVDANRRPVFHAPGASGKFAGHAHVGFNEGTWDDFLDVTGVTPHGSVTLVAVFSQDDKLPHNYGLLATYQDANNRGTFATMYYQAGNPLGHWDFTVDKHVSTFSPTQDTEHVAVWRIDGSNVIDFQVDGVSHGSFALTSDMHSVFSRYLIGATDPTAANPFAGQLAELVVYDRALHDCERDALVGGLGTQYGVDVNGAGTGACDPPSAPTNLSAVTVDHRTIDLSWTDASTNEDGFLVERRQGQTGAFALLADLGPGSAAYSDDTASASTEYCYRVSAYNGDGASGYTTVQCATTDPSPVAPPPVDAPQPGLTLRLVANELGLADGATVDSWPNFGGSEGDATQDDPARRPTFHGVGATGRLGGQAHVGFSPGQLLDVGGVTSHGSTTLVVVFSQDNTAAHNHGVFGIYENANNRGTFATMYSQPGNPLGHWDFSVDKHVSTFSPTAGADHVAVWRIDGSNVIDFQVDGVSHGSFPITSDMHSVFSHYLVGATDPSGANPFEGQIAELVVYDRALLDCERDGLVGALGTRYGVDVGGVGANACNPPADPIGLAAIAQDYRTVAVSWTDLSVDEDGFRLERSQGPGGPFQLLADLPPNTATFADSSVIPTLDYCYRVFAYNEDGPSGPSNVECATPPSPPPGVCYDTGNHDDLSDLWGIERIRAEENEHWVATQVPGCEMKTWIFVLDSGIDSDHPDLNVAGVHNFVVADAGNTGEDGHGHGTHVAGTAAAIDGNGGVVGVAPGAPLYGFRVCGDDGSCQGDDILAAIDSVTAIKLGNPLQPMVANMSLAGSVTPPIDEGVRGSVNAGVVYAVGAGNGIIGACFFPNDAQQVSPAGVGDDEINAANGSDGNNGRINGVLTVTLSTETDQDGDCNYGNPVTIAAPGANILSTWINGGYNIISGTSMASPHGAGAAALYLQEFPTATPAEVEAWLLGQLEPWTTDDLPNADGRLNVKRP